MAELTGVYDFTKDNFRVSADMKKNFEDDGYILVREFFNDKEMTNLRKVFEESDLVDKHGLKVGDGSGKKTKIALWTHPGSDVSGMMARCDKIVNTCEELLGEEVYHYHGKLLYKDAFTGGAHLWHQDYGYWYRNTCLFPNMMTVFIAIDKCARTNGCLQILPGSQKCGRIDHVMVSGQMTATAERVEAVKNVCPLAYVEMEPGDALFFHCNLLHCSSANDSPDRRWAYLIAYNTKANNPVVPHHHAQYTPIQRVPNSAVEECTNYTDFTDKEFLTGHESKLTSKFDKSET
ncbi:L-proline trans-4-hydroxylase-like [Ylistrum balloti]|uniref:L-proline trans-4-hydroxylase-like n=1 Tax=Ylistrum balloti TaxID=509963 RepID=UPI002905B851|nr:L-proline trans-4-hydroxylase-like [Ylistrum balloti]